MNNDLLFDKSYGKYENNARSILRRVRSPVTLHGFKGSSALCAGIFDRVHLNL